MFQTTAALLLRGAARAPLLTTRCLTAAAAPAAKRVAKKGSAARRGAEAAAAESGGAVVGEAAGAPAPAPPLRGRPRKTDAKAKTDKWRKLTTGPQTWRASVQFVARTGRWEVSVRPPAATGAASGAGGDGVGVQELGAFVNEVEAHAAAAAALATHYPMTTADGSGAAAGGGGSDARRRVPGLMGVVDAGDGKFEAVVELPGDRVLSGGLHASATDAARARDAVARMYLGDGVATNFEARASTAWAPEPLVRPGGGGDAPPLVPVLPGVKLTVDEVVLLLNAHAGVDVSSLDLAGKNDIAGFMVFVTGRTPGHMRRLADSVSDAARARAPYPGVRDVGVEDREGDYWMLVDLGDIIVNVFDAVAREAFAIEPWYASMKLGEDPQGNFKTHDEWLAANPIPPAWIARLEADEAELARGRRARGNVGGGYDGDVERPAPVRVGSRAKKRAASKRSKTLGEGGL